MATFRRRQTQVEAVRWTGENEQAVRAFASDADAEVCIAQNGTCWIKRGRTEEHRLCEDWWVTNHNGRLEVFDDHEFDRDFEPIPSPDPAEELLAVLKDGMFPDVSLAGFLRVVASETDRRDWSAKLIEKARQIESAITAYEQGKGA